MNRDQATQIATLLKQNQLTTEHTTDSVLNASDNYVFLEEEDKVVACAEIKKVQWYQWEVSHVSVLKPRRGLGNKIVTEAEKVAKQKNAKVIQCTIRSDNESSIGLFKSRKYSQGVTFYYPNSGNDVIIFQKTLSIR